MKKGLEIIAVCKDHSKTNTPEVEEHITIPFDFMLDKIVSQFTDSNFEPIDYKITEYKQSILTLVDNAIKEDRVKAIEFLSGTFTKSAFEALTELKGKIEAL